MGSIMNQKMADITLAQVLAASPGARSYIINQLRNQKLEVNHLEQQEEHHQSKHVVGEDSIKLREIEVFINHNVEIRAVIDSGSQIITLREDVWRDSGMTINPETKITLESANKTLSSTLGTVDNLPITIGTETFYVRAQVVKESPTPMLLGMPFFSLTKCQQDVSTDGYMSLRLANPNPPHNEITVPTMARRYYETPTHILDTIDWADITEYDPAVDGEGVLIFDAILNPTSQPEPVF